jgi:YqaJ-like viral recombinase domain
VQLGSATEELNRSWYERNTGRQVRDGQRQVRNSAISWIVATLDGIVEGAEAVLESKFMLPWWSFSEEAAEKYMSQLQYNMWVTHLRSALHHHGRRQVDSHGSTLSQRPRKFWRCVQSGEVPIDHERAKTELKARMPEDAKEAIDHGVRRKRSRSGAVSFDVLSTEAGPSPVQ